MWNEIGKIFSSEGFVPHIHCYLGRSSLVWSTVATDAVIGLSYLSISISLGLLVRKVKLPFQGLFMAFGFFILACSATHFMEIYNLWVPNYWLAILVKMISAVASLLTAAALYPLAPKIVEYVKSLRFSVEKKKELERTYESMESRTEELYRSQTFLNSLLENLPNMVFVKHASDLRFVRINKTGEQLLGLNRSELLGKNDFDFFPKEQAEFFVNKDRLVLAEGRLVDIPFEEINTKDHGKRILHTRKIPVYDHENRPEYLLGISEDITEKVKADEEHVRMNREQSCNGRTGTRKQTECVSCRSEHSAGAIP